MRTMPSARACRIVAAVMLLFASARADAVCTDCTRLGDFAGPEDVQLYRPRTATPRLIDSAYDRRRKGDGGLWEIPIENGQPGAPRLLAATVEGCPLRPHGISIVETEAGALLYVIQHPHRRDHGAGGCNLGSQGRRSPLDRLLVFRLEPGNVRFERALVDPALQGANDVVALASGDVYVSTPAKGFWGLLELLGLPTSRIVHRRDGGWNEYGRGDLRYANGVAADAEHLYVGATIDRDVVVFAREASSGAVGDVIARIHVGSGVDNLDWDRGALLTAAHPRLGTFFHHSLSADTLSPSEAYRVRDPAGAATVERLHWSSGALVGAASTAVVVDHGAEPDVLYLGQVFGRGLARCRCRDDREGARP